MKLSVIFFGAVAQLKLYCNFILCCDNYPASCRLHTPVYHNRDHLPSTWVVRAAAGRDYHSYGELSSNHILRSSYSDAASGLYTPMYHNGHDFPRGSKHLIQYST
ncbi:unnamed protein product [Clonostachys rhizophaga]|uniref:Uncharacterized protein n=1 Tax=Clonostachys rhizophaga TaxID=160324 RepID=A0A9N9VMG9_9HYPO|nr:unnamed protein product [Clonostachys rhizophaga]